MDDDALVEQVMDRVSWEQEMNNADVPSAEITSDEEEEDDDSVVDMEWNKSGDDDSVSCGDEAGGDEAGGDAAAEDEAGGDAEEKEKKEGGQEKDVWYYKCKAFLNHVKNVNTDLIHI